MSIESYAININGERVPVWATHHNELEFSTLNKKTVMATFGNHKNESTGYEYKYLNFNRNTSNVRVNLFQSISTSKATKI